ncbi:MAG: DinB family protein [Candidatus Heimdallarchaeota archaeon]|nr:DinB family protein [Candidatus Heimdallarchaeota archaeon]
MNTLSTMFAWNAWANRRYRQVFSEMQFEELNRETPYGNLLDRIVHIFASFEMWYQRLQGESPTDTIKAADFNNWSELERKWIELDHLMLGYVDFLSDEELEQEVQYTSLDGKKYSRKQKHILLHLTAHPNYHRGQLSTYFKMEGLPALPSTDMVLYFLEVPE